MAVLPMKHIRIIALKKNRKAILELVQRLGCMEIHASDEKDDLFKRQDMSQSSQVFLRNKNLADEALSVLEKYSPEDKGLLASLEGKGPLDVPEYEKRVTERDSILETCRNLTDLEKRHAELSARLPGFASSLVALEPWMDFDLPLDFKGTEKTAAFLGTLPGQKDLEAIETDLNALCPSAGGRTVEIISRASDATYIFVVCEKKKEDEVRDALRRMNFAKPVVSSHETPAEAKKSIENNMEDTKAQITSIEEEIRGLVGKREDIKFLSDYFQMRADKYDVISGLAQSSRVFVLEGYSEADKVPALEKKLTGKFDLIFEAEDPGPDEDVPVILRNNPFARPVEGVVESYSMPGAGERDPSSLVALFYYVLFGFMLSDAGYGIIMVVLSMIVLKKFKNMDEGLHKTLLMLRNCGAATIVVGFLFGSFFGNAVNVIATTFFDRPDINLPAIWLDPLKEPMRMLGICFVIGIIHLFVGLGAQMVYDFKDHKILDAIYDCIFWYMFVGGLILWLLTLTMVTDMFSMAEPLPAVCGKIGAVLALIGFVGVVLTSGRSSRNWFKRLLKGLYGAYGISSWLSDILSYSRLLALGLATSVISQVFNTMGQMVATGNGVIGAIAFIVIFVIGHILNLLINALGAYVHTNRLTFVEFFGKFYEGGGKAFRPFKAQTKYFTIREEN